MPEIMAHTQSLVLDLFLPPPSHSGQKCTNQWHPHTREVKQVHGDILCESLRFQLIKKWQ